MHAFDRRDLTADAAADPVSYVDLAVEGIDAQVDRVAGSACFEHAPTLRRLFRHIAEHSRTGDFARLKEYALGVDVFDRGTDFDPRTDTIVRVQARRLRDRLAEYHRSEGAADALVLEVPKGGYQLKIVPRAACVQAVAAVPSPVSPHNLPAAIGPLIGRDDDLEELVALVVAERLVTLVGTGGMGKTRLAVEAARRLLPDFPGGVWFVALDRLTDPALVAEAVLTALGVTIEGQRPPVEVIVRHLRAVRALIILDNAEHVLGAVAELALAVLRSAAGIRIVVTSREMLGLPEEQLFVIPALAVPPEGVRDARTAERYPAVQLLLRRAAAATGSFKLRDDDAPTVGVICRRLDGIPLAIELAAAWLKMLSLDDIAAALAQRIELLARSSRAGPERHRTLRATLEWSHALLEPAERKLFRRLSVFAGGWTLGSAAEVTESEPPALLLRLAALVDKSLVVAEATPAGLRYRMIETTRAYAAERYRSDDEGGGERRLAMFMRELLERASIDFDQIDSSAFLRCYAPEIHNLRAALAWADGPDGDPALVAALAAASVYLFCELGMINDARRWPERALPFVDEDRAPAVAASIYLALAFRFATGVAATRELAESACRAARRADDPILLARTLLTLVQPLRFWEPGRAEATIDEALTLCRPFGHSKALAFALAAKALSASLAGDHAQADAGLAESIGLMRRFGYRFGLPWAHILKSECKILARDLPAAIAAAREAVAAGEDSGIRALTGMAAGGLAACLALAGERDDSLVWSRRALADADDVQETVVTVSVLETLALLILPEAPREAARLAGFVAAQRRSLLAQRRPSEAGVCLRLEARLAEALPIADRVQLAADGALLSIAGLVQRYTATSVEPATR